MKSKVFISLAFSSDYKHQWPVGWHERGFVDYGVSSRCGTDTPGELQSRLPQQSPCKYHHRGHRVAQREILFFKPSLGYSVSSVVILFIDIEEKFVWVLTLQFS